MVPRDELEGYPKQRRYAWWIAVAIAAAVGLFFLLRPAPERPVPDFDLPLLTGAGGLPDDITSDGSVSSDELEGDPVVLNFWKADCPPCKDEAPVLERAWRRYRERGVRIIGVNVQTTRANAQRFVEEFGMTFPTVRDADQSLVEDLGVYGFPQTFFIDEDWSISSAQAGERIGTQGGTVVLGAISEEELTRRIESLLEVDGE